MQLVTRISPTYQAEFDQIRRECFPGPYPSGSAQDPYDERCSHVIIEDVKYGEIAALGRVCRGPNAFFEEWLNDSSQIPVGRDVIDIGRCLVAKKYRGLGLMRILSLEAVALGDRMRMQIAVGATIPDDPHVAPLLREIGFVDAGPVQNETEPSGITLPVQPLKIDLLETEKWRASLLKQVIEMNVRKGVEVLPMAYQGFPPPGLVATVTRKFNLDPAQR